MVSSATIPAKMASTGTGARRISSSTTGISTTAVAIRFSKGVLDALKDRAIITRAGTGAVFFLGATQCSGFYEFRGSVIEAAVAALALLIFRNAFEKVKAAKIRP